MKMIRFVTLLIFSGFIFPQQQVNIPWPSLADSPWPTTHGDAQATGRSNNIGPRNANYVVKKDMPLGVSFGPVIGYDDILFNGSASLNTDPFNRFYSLTPYLDTIWSFITPTAWPNNNGPTLGADSTIYFASNGGGVYAIDYSGNLKWKKDEITYGGYPMISIAKNGNLYLSERNRLLILDKYGNTVKDSTIIDFAAKEFLFSVGGDTIYFINYDNNDNQTLKAADLDLNIYWSIDIYDTKQGIPLIDNSNKIYIYTRDGPSESYLKCFLPDGNFNWQFPFRSFAEFSSPAMDSNGNIVIAVKRDTSILVEVISMDYFGNENWSTVIRQDQATVEGNIISDSEGKIYLVSEGFNDESYLHCLDSSGGILWEVFLNDNSFISSAAINSDGVIYVGGFKSTSYPYHTENFIAVSENPLDVDIKDILPTGFELSQNYPNPFNSTTKIKFGIPEASEVSLKVYDVIGREISTLVSEEKQTGVYEVEFNTSELSSGIYFYQLKAGDFAATKKLILLK